MARKRYEILSGDTVVAAWDGKQLSVKNEQLLPLFLKRVPNADLWLASRAIDAHRTHSRLLKKALRMEEKDDVATALRANGATVTDNYWVRPEGSELTYRDVRFDAAYFSRLTSRSLAKLALSGSSSSFNYVASKSQSLAAELTNTGSFEKCWKNVDGQWWLFKNANKNELFSELFVYHLCAVAGISCAVYERHEKWIRTRDFTEGTFNFEPAFAFMGEEEDYEKTIFALEKLCPAAIPDYVRMIFVDALVMNPDRHTANFGLLRDRTTGELIGLAPLFDHNMALVARGYPEKTGTADLLISLFRDVIEAHPDYAQYMPQISEGMVRDAIRSTGMQVRTETIVAYVMGRYRAIVGVI